MSWTSFWRKPPKSLSSANRGVAGVEPPTAPWLGLEPLEPRVLLSAAAPGAQVVQLFGLSPALFVANQGQWADPSVRYIHKGSGANIAITDAGPVFQVFRPDPNAPAGDAATANTPADLLTGLPGQNPDSTPAPTQMLQFSATFLGANTVTPIGEQEAPAKFNYLLGDQSQWHSDVPGFAVVEYQGLYQGIDLLTQGQVSHLKYEFHVHPAGSGTAGGDWTQIQVHYAGIGGLSLAADGSLVVDLGNGWGQITDDAPVIYQDAPGAPGQRVNVAGRFKLLDANTYGFEVTGSYDHTKELVIDPDLAWATYLGGINDDPGYGIAVDSAGNTYVIGQTNSSGWAMAGAYDTSFNGDIDVFVAKLDPTGSQLLYATYLGGSGTDQGFGIALDTAGNAYVTGITSSSGWATGGAYDTSYNGSGDAFVAKLNPTGSQLLYATYLGAERYESGRSITVDAAGNAYVTGDTTSSGWATPGAYDSSFNGSIYYTDAFVAKLNPAGSQLLYATYLGGSGSDFGMGIAVDTSGDAYVAGQIGSSGCATPGAYDTTIGGAMDGFVAKLNPAGSQLLYSTYLGGPQDDSCSAIAVDSSGNAYVTGGENFVTKLSATGSQVLFAAPLSLSNNSGATSIALDAANNIYVTGQTASAGWATPGAYDTTYNGGNDVFVAILNPSGSQFVYTTYLGGTANDYASDIALDAAGNIYVTGFTASSGWATPTAYDTSYNGAGLAGYGDAFVAKLGIKLPSAAFDAVTPAPRCDPVDSLTIHFNEPIAVAPGSFDLSDLTLTRGGVGVPMSVAGGQSLTTADNQNFTLTGLTALTAPKGSYVLKLTAAGSGITDLAGKVLMSDASTSFIVTLMGDGNCDGSVDGLDAALWATNFTGALGVNPPNPKTWQQGDWNRDGSVDGLDIALWATHFTGALGGGPLSGGVSPLSAATTPVTLESTSVGAGLVPTSAAVAGVSPSPAPALPAGAPSHRPPAAIIPPRRWSDPPPEFVPDFTNFFTAPGQRIDLFDLLAGHGVAALDAPAWIPKPRRRA